MKPVVVDDAAYLLIARHIAQHPADPYGHTLFWYDRPEPAMEILAPPVLPYWLALGMAVFGENLLLLKLSLYPLAWLLAHSTVAVVRRWIGPGAEWAVVALVLGPGVLPFFNFMLDIPALALALSAVACLQRGCESGKWWWYGLAGVAAGLALQTKYSVLAVPLVLMLIGWQQGCLRATLGAVGVALLVFVIIEWWCGYAQGQSHFLHHLSRRSQTVGATFAERLENRVKRMGTLGMPMLAHLGLTALPIALVALVGLGCSRRVTLGAVLVGCLGVLIVAVVPGWWQVIVPGRHPAVDRITFAHVVFITIGTLAAGAVVWAAYVGMFRSRFVLRPSRIGIVLCGWLVLELAAYFVLTPFPAGRRLVGLTWIGTLMVARLVQFLGQRQSWQWVKSTILILAMITCLVVQAVDCWDAQVEPWVARAAVELAQAHHLPGKGYAVGHWGFQYTLDRLGVTLIVPGETRLQPGDWLILPDYPDRVGFYRPHHGEADIQRDPTAIVPVGRIVWDDWLAAQTIPSLYGGKVPLIGRIHPRLQATVYRVTQNWIPAVATSAE